MNVFQKILILLLSVLLTATFAKEHPTIAINKSEARAIREALGKYPLLDKSYAAYETFVNAALQRVIEVPPPGEAGGYAHEKHKQNYREMHQAGILFAINGEEIYAAFIKAMLDEYAKMYPTLGPHPRSFKQKPGRLFHQTLNEAVWLVHVSIAYDCIYNWLNAEDRQRYEESIFRPMIHLFSVEHAEMFNLIHNHGTWSTAAVGMMAYVLDEPELVERALYGTNLDGKGGFLKQMEQLFSPDGFYMEGPYYIRYALRPFFLFADAIERNEPERKIYQYRDEILRKAYYSVAQTIFPDGIFPPINDASKTMDIADIGPMIANNLTYQRYGKNENLLAIARLQDRVMLNQAGLTIANDFGDGSTVAELNWGSVEFSDGYDGERGGLGILRTGSGKSQTMLLMKYGVHGKGHGHFDKLQFIFYDQYHEVIPDYGFARWINMEPKHGGRYTRENNSFAKQTVAHNVVVVDETSQNNANRKKGDAHWAERHFFDGNGSDIQVMSARANQQYEGVAMQRTMFLIRDEKLEHPAVIDLYRLQSDSEHQYDYPIYYNGQFVVSNVAFDVAGNSLRPMGEKAGYEHLWKTAAGKSDSTIIFTWVDGGRYYSLISAGTAGTEMLLGRIGANDPDFNLRSGPMMMLRLRAADHLFASVIEPHGFFSEAREMSRDARSVITSVEVIGHDDEGSVVDIRGKRGLHWRIMVNNGAPTSGEKTVSFEGKTYRWQGNYAIEKLN